MRDTQKALFGQAEARAQDVIFAEGRAGNEDIREQMSYFETDIEAQGFCDVVCDRLSLPRVRVQYVTGADACFRSGIVELPPWARQRFTVLHELAHHMTHPIFPPHGAEYVENLLLVLRIFMPHRVVELYLDHLLAANVDVVPSSKQALRFLTYARRLEQDRIIKIIVADGKMYTGRLISYDRTTQVCLGSGSKVNHEVPCASLRYASWAIS